MSEPAKAEKAAPPKAATATPRSTAPLPKQPGQSPATPTLAKLRRAIVIQGLIIAFVAYAAVEIGAEAGQLTEGFWHPSDPWIW